MNNYYLCINSKENKCCIFISPMGFNDLKNFIDKYPTLNLPGEFDATNWGGRDDIDRTIVKENFKLTNNIINYSGYYKGQDYDMGHSYQFKFRFDKLVQVKKNKF